MIYERLKIKDVVLCTPKKFSDSRGFFMETFKKNTFSDFLGKDINFLQSNHSLSRLKNTIRGLHYQSPPYAQGKLVRCNRGAILDVAVDVRARSVTYGDHVVAELSSQNARQLWIPDGFLHGFITLVDNTEVQYMCTDYYDSKSDGNIIWNDRTLNINWGIMESDAIISDKDMSAPLFKSFRSPFQ